MNVYYMRGSEKCLMGRLAIKDRHVYFEYDADFLKTGLELSPFKLPLKTGVVRCDDHSFDGLFGVFNDSLPDGWGRLLLDRKLITLGIQPGTLSPLDRLSYVGKHGMGALTYEPEKGEISPVLHDNLDDVAEEAFRFLNDDDQYVDDLLVMNGSSAGARPKILVSFDDHSFKASDTNMEPPTNYWLIKFQSSLESKDCGAIEYAYHLMAKSAGLDVPEAKLFPSKQGPGYFGVKRFDRMNGKRIHMQTISGLLHLDHRIPSFDYETLLKVTWKLTKNIQECEKQFQAVVFNVLAHNRDDHVKNFSFIMDTEGIWRTSPAYDITHSSGPFGEHCTTIMGEGKSPQSGHLLALAETVGISKTKALKSINEVKSAILEWKRFADKAGVSKKSISLIESVINPLKNNRK